MRKEWHYFKQGIQIQDVYRILYLLILIFFLFLYYFGDKGYVLMPWEFYKERQGFSIEKVLLNSMPIIFYSIGILLPIEHFKNYLTDIRIFEIIRQHKSRYRYGYFVVFSLTYIFSYMALNVILMWFLGYRGSFGSGIGQAGLVMGVLLSIVALFSLFDSWSLGNVVALIILIVYSGFTFPERKEICFLGILFVALGFINHLIYLRREIY